ncbi:chemotaxis response regulator protein-glutamate methylesterase [candidate division FCPU426 bacterium]|nr:chemotaxis response regulator protein-glutamate methylesterase [candidate division FCPU426 bacterium]
MIRVMVVDDSPVICVLLVRALSGVPDIKVVGTAGDPYIARDKIAALKPDVITLDIEMPRMNGLTFLEKVMTYYPLPVIVVSSFNDRASMPAVRALEIGAVDVVQKPEHTKNMEMLAQVLIEKIRLAAGVHFQKNQQQEKWEKMEAMQLPAGQHRLLAIGASTGGTEAIAKLMQVLPENIPATLVVQHLPAQFTAAFAQRLNQISGLQVSEARGGEPLFPGRVLVAPGGRHLAVTQSGEGYQAVVRDGPEVYRHRPSVEVLFQSVAKNAGAHAVGVLLTGMGRDGAEGLLAMRQAGAFTVAQDEKTSVVYGMPKAAVDIGAAQSVLPLEEIPRTIMQAFSSRKSNKPSTGRLPPALEKETKR